VINTKYLESLHETVPGHVFIDYPLRYHDGQDCALLIGAANEGGSFGSMQKAFFRQHAGSYPLLAAFECRMAGATGPICSMGMVR
jgi:hypothetical protein